MISILAALFVAQASPSKLPIVPKGDPKATGSKQEEPNFDLLRYFRERPGPYKHDRLFLRFTFGWGYFTSSARSATDRWVLRGPEIPIELAIGWAPFENLVLFVDAAGDAVNPSSMDARFGPLSAGRTSAEAGVGSVGGGLAYYFTSANVHVTASLNRGSLYLDAPARVVGQTASGYCAALMVGHEFWIYEQLGIGFGLRVQASRLPDRNIASRDARWTALSFALVMTETIN